MSAGMLTPMKHHHGLTCRNHEGDDGGVCDALARLACLVHGMQREDYA